MEWNLKAPCWDLGEVDKATVTLPNIETMDDSSRFGVYKMKGEFCVDLKLGQVGNSGTESVVLAKSKDDAVAGASGASVGAAQGSKVVTSPSGSFKRARAINNATMTVSCLVDGCNSDLSNCRDYHRRHKVCELHSKTPEVTIGGLKQRFCQQCSRFHSLEQFDERKRSCRKRLDGHNRRRRKPQPEPPTRHGSFLSNYQGTQLLPFSSAHVYPSTAMVSPAWSVTSSADARLHHNHNQHHQQQDHLFIGSSPTSSYNNSNNNNSNNKKEGKQLAFLQGENPSTAALNNQSTPPLFPPASSVCQSTLLPLSESCGVRSKIMFCDDNNNSSNNNRSSLIATNSVHDDSPCALSLLSSSQTQNTPCLNQMVHHPPSMSLMQQPLGLCLQDSNSLESVVPNNGSDHCSSMYNLGSDHDGSQCNEAPQLFPFQWE